MEDKVKERDIEKKYECSYHSIGFAKEEEIIPGKRMVVCPFTENECPYSKSKRMGLDGDFFNVCTSNGYLNDDDIQRKNFINIVKYGRKQHM